MPDGDTSYDCIVIGSGPGGYVAAIRAAQLEMRTAVVEKDRVGGRCLNYACIPAKAVLRVADVLSEIREADEYGLKVGEPEVDYAAVSDRRRKVISTLTGGVSGLFKKNGIEVIEGEGSLAGEGTVKVGDQALTASTIVLATGSVKRPLPGTQFGGRVIGTEEAWALDKLPRTLAVVGAGASGAEIASAYARLGVEVMLFEALDRVLPTEDADISKLVERGLKRQGIATHTGTLVENVESSDEHVTFSYGDQSAEVDWLAIAAGRGPDVDVLGLDQAGVKLDEQGLVEVDGALRTSANGIYAIGDLVLGPALAHKASDEGVIAVEDAAGMETHPIEYIDIPRATFCTPNVASFGLTEAQAKEQGYDVVVGKVQYGAVGAGIVYGDRSGLVKIVGERKYGELLGGHIVGSKATELIQELVNARVLEGGFPEVARTIHGHPTLSEAIMEAARAADGWLIPRVSTKPEQPVFYYDLGDPACYLAAERITSELPTVPEWEPVLADSLGITPAEVNRTAIERQATERDMQPLRWPPRVPTDTRTALLAATFAKRSGRAVAFSLAAFRQAFAAGRDLGELDTVLLAGAACEIHPAAIVKGIGLRSVQAALDAAGARAREAGVGTLPALQVGTCLFEGDTMIERAASAIAAGAR